MERTKHTLRYWVTTSCKRRFAVIASRWLSAFICKASLPKDSHLFGGFTPQRLNAIRINHILMMMTQMFADGHELKIFQSVIVFHLINVVHNFSVIKESAQMLRHYKDMFTYVATFIGAWMSGHSKKYISALSVLDSATSPIKIIQTFRLVPLNKATWKSLDRVFVAKYRRTATTFAFDWKRLKARPFWFHSTNTLPLTPSYAH